MGPVRVRIGRPGYDWPMDPRPAPGSPHRRPPLVGDVRAADGSRRSGAGASSDFDGRPGMPDRFGRALRDLRISVTDRCNFRCPYCMPAEVFGRDFAFLPKELVLSFEEITRLAAIFVGLGVGKLRITGGEPLVRRDLPVLIASSPRSGRRTGEPVDLTLTTNGSALRPLAAPLAEAGLQRITVSLDSLDDEVFGTMNGVDFPVSQGARRDRGRARGRPAPIKVNTVVRRGMNEASVLPLARWARDEGLILRFIEYMDVGHSNGWRLDDVVPAEEILASSTPRCRWSPSPPQLPRRGRRALRVTATGRARWGSSRRSRSRSAATARARACRPRARSTRACSRSPGTDLKGPLRAGATDDELADLITSVWTTRADRYSELRSAATEKLPKVEMFALGG